MPTRLRKCNHLYKWKEEEDNSESYKEMRSQNQSCGIMRKTRLVTAGFADGRQGLAPKNVGALGSRERKEKGLSPPERIL